MPLNDPPQTLGQSLDQHYQKQDAFRFEAMRVAGQNLLAHGFRNSEGKTESLAMLATDKAVPLVDAFCQGLIKHLGAKTKLSELRVVVGFPHEVDVSLRCAAFECKGSHVGYVRPEALRGLAIALCPTHRDFLLKIPLPPPSGHVRVHTYDTGSVTDLPFDGEKPKPEQEIYATADGKVSLTRRPGTDALGRVMDEATPLSLGRAVPITPPSSDEDEDEEED